MTHRSTSLVPAPTLQIECGPAVLRALVPTDAHQLFRMASDPAVSRYLTWDAHTSIEDSLEFIRDATALWARETAFLCGIFNSDSNLLMGSTGVSSIDRADQRAEVGTWLGTTWQGRGFNKACKAAVFTLAFDVLQLHRLELLVRVDNEHSLRAMKRLPGVVHEGIQHMRIWKHGRAFDAHMFSLTSDAWQPDLYPTVTVRGALRVSG